MRCKIEVERTDGANSRWRKGGTLGPSIVPGDAEKSLLMRAVLYQDKDLQMPPDGKLSPEDIEVFRRWIQTLAEFTCTPPCCTSSASTTKNSPIDMPVETFD